MEENVSQVNSKKKLIIVLLVLSAVLLLTGFLLMNSNNSKTDEKEGSNTNNIDVEDNDNENINELKLGNCLNCNYTSPIEIISDNESDLLKVSIKEDQKSVEIKIEAESINSYGYNVTDRTITKRLDKEIKEVYINSTGGDNGNLTIYYLMKDGTIKYTKVFDEIQKDKFNDLSDDDLFNTKEYKDVKNVKEIDSVVIGKDSNLPTYSVIAVRDDGDYYDLGLAS